MAPVNPPKATKIRVKNLGCGVSNELLSSAFSQFGEIISAVVEIDEKEFSIGEGIVQFQHAKSANMAITRCQEDFYLLTSSLRPIKAELIPEEYSGPGLPEDKMARLPSNVTDRELGPRIAVPGTYEYNICTQWKTLEEDHENKIKNLRETIKQEIEEFEDEIQLQITAHKAKQLRKRLSDVEKEYTIMEQERTRKRRLSGQAAVKEELEPQVSSPTTSLSGLAAVKEEKLEPQGDN
ncbi:hypothetical protein JTE90_009553 [Oedothorax gibbosus]|uniref:RRM domain-containing protein n=1 Tax=Oedothorax gibbosus TaxID=931172 RepID=A0AAV6TJ00_9ARAC|nr:hypothetical protein JTE90_009553 [Oedothorax gibbosus]